ncbi:hypothetical protein Pla52o_23850 [Novipirellula galeiformis]|uniref:Uncharacterized protein n=1 Tax=Novipirellula galeiformis TaxID=2528004 RepID=A0A5C6CLL9_9BACT|nr:hypothetical protein Pla52o_23850 [Novipirellula galeiformis]
MATSLPTKNVLYSRVWQAAEHTNVPTDRSISIADRANGDGQRGRASGASGAGPTGTEHLVGACVSNESGLAVDARHSFTVATTETIAEHGGSRSRSSEIGPMLRTLIYRRLFATLES